MKTKPAGGNNVLSTYLNQKPVFRFFSSFSFSPVGRSLTFASGRNMSSALTWVYLRWLAFLASFARFLLCPGRPLFFFCCCCCCCCEPPGSPPSKRRRGATHGGRRVTEPNAVAARIPCWLAWHARSRGHKTFTHGLVGCSLLQKVLFRAVLFTLGHRTASSGRDVF